MTPLTRSRLPVRLIVLAALLLALVVVVGPVAAATPTVTANPALVPFSTVPGQPGTTQLTFAAKGTAGLTACGQDNRNPPFVLGAVDPNTSLVVNFPYIQAGTYTFWVSADASCGEANNLAQATATRVGPTGRAGEGDDIAFLPHYGNQSIDPTRTYPMAGEQLCIMSGDGATVTTSVVVGQDPRLYGADSNHVTVTPFAGQNGCYDIPWIVTGYYGACVTRDYPDGCPPAPTPGGRLDVRISYVSFCSEAWRPDNYQLLASPPPNPGGAPGGAWHCAKISYQLTTGGVSTPLQPTDVNNRATQGTVLTGAAMTGADDHAIQTCFYLAVPGDTGNTGTLFQFGNKPQGFNGSGAISLTPLPFDNFPPGSRAFLDTYDINNPNTNGGLGGTVKDCPQATATFSGGSVVAFQLVNPAHMPNMDLLDRRNFANGF